MSMIRIKTPIIVEPPEDWADDLVQRRLSITLTARQLPMVVLTVGFGPTLYSF